MFINKLNAPMSKSIALALFTAASSLVLSSCQDEDYGYETDTIRASVYSRNFQKMYGEIDPDQTWDFSSYNLRKLGLAGGPSDETRGGGVYTRAEIPGLVNKYNSGWYTVSAKTTTWLNSHLKEKVNNTTYVSSFNWEKVSDSDPLYIIPIYQGQTGMIWDLELVDLDSHTSSIIWSKSENLQYTQHFKEWDEFFYESWESEEAPATSMKNNYGINDNKLQTLKFGKPLSSVPSTFSSSDDIIAAFNVSREIPGAFYITLGDNTKPTKLTADNCSAFFTNTDNAKMVKTDGLFHFTTDGNFELNVERYLSNPTPNKVYLNALLGVSIDGHAITVADLKTLQFVIDDSFNYPYGSDNKFNHDYTFNTWSPDRIRVYIKYNEGETGTTVSLKDGTNQYTEHHTINKINVQTRPIKIDITQLTGSNFALNLKTKYRGDGDKELSEIGDDHRSDKGYMSQINHFADDEPIDVVALSSTLKTQFSINDLDGDFEYMVIGCEDAGANGKKSDNDYNDLVLLVVGKTLPTQTIKKRYMIEDLGSTLDFDFNDIVVDLTERVARTNEGKTYTQTAAIRHLRGTIPFRVTIGNNGKFGTEDNLGKIMRGHNSGGLEYDPSTADDIKSEYIWEHKHVITGTTKTEKDASLATLRANYWNPDANNIYVEVWPSYNSENSQLSDVFWTGGEASKEDNSNATGNNVQSRKIVEFPKKGKVPYIIAVDPTVQWMDENISIPEFWIATRPEHFNNNFDQSDKTEDDKPTGTGIPNGGAGNHLMNPTTIPAGSVVLNANPTSNPIVITDFTNVYKGEDIIVHVNGEYLYDNSRLVFKTNSDNKTIESIGVDGKVVVTGDYKIALTNDMLSKGLKIESEHVTLTKISAGGAIISSANTVTATANATQVANSRKVIHSYSDGLTISNNDLKNLYVGDRIIVHVENLRANSNLGFKKNTDNWPAFDYDGGLLVTSEEISNGTGTTADNNANVTGDIVLVLNKDNIDDIQNGNGLVINGQYVTISSVQIDKAGGCQSITNNNKVTNGIAIDGFTTTIFSNEWNSVSVPSDKFSKLSVGDKVVVHVDNLRGNGSNNSLVGVHQSDWTKAFADVTYSNNTEGNFYNVKGDIELNVTSNNIDQFKNGLILQGQYVNITGISIVPTSTYALKVSVMPNQAGSVTIDGKSIDGNFDGQSYGTTTLVASEPNEGYEFLAWAGKGSPSTNRTFNVSDASTLYAYYGNVVFSNLEIAAGDYSAYPLFRVSSGNDDQKSRYSKLNSVLTNNNSQLMIYFTDATASGWIKLKTEGNAEGDWAWTDLPSIAKKVEEAGTAEEKENVQHIEIKNGVARYKLSEDDVTRIKDEKSLGLTIISSNSSLKISKFIVTSTWY